MNDLQAIAEILAIGAAIQPLFLGAIFLFMFKYFPSRKEIELMEENQKARHGENTQRNELINKRMDTIEGDIKKILSMRSAEWTRNAT